MNQTQNTVVSATKVENPVVTDQLEVLSFARFLAARLREVLAVKENRCAAEEWKKDHISNS